MVGTAAPEVVTAGRAGDIAVALGRKQLQLTNLDKVLYPAVGFTKGQVIDYYERVAPAILPHLKNRPVSLKRFPNGVEGKSFWEKECPEHRPKWVRTAAIWSEVQQQHLHFCLVNDLPTLVWLANRAALELHTSLSRGTAPDRPTAVVFDLDPGPPATIVQCAQVALRLREVLETQSLKSFAKTSGSKGLQIFVPLNTPTSYDATKPFAHALAVQLEREQPDLVVSKMTRSLRPGKVLVDWSQNEYHKTTVSVYSLRAKTRPTVSTPVSWEEVEQTSADSEPDRLVFEVEQALQRIDRLGDLFEPVHSLKQKLPKGVAASD